MVHNSWNMFGSILVFLLVLSILVLVHELGHFLAARKSGIWVEEFGIGLPPRVIGKKIKNTIYSINALPFGGFVRLHGEMGDEGVTVKSKAFLYKSKLTKVFVLLSGVVMNFVLAVIAFAIVYSFSGIPKETGNVKIIDISTGSPAQISGLVVGDIITKVGETKVTTSDSFMKLIEPFKGKKVTLFLEDGKKITLTPRENPPEGEGPLGVTISSIDIYYPPVWQRPFVGVYYGFTEAVFWGKNVVLGFGNVFSELFKGQIPKDISGPVGIFAITTEASRTGILALINLIGVISVNLAILNVAPFPALDGGRLLFVLIEGLVGKKVVPKVEATIHTIGMIILLTLILAITIHDVQRLISAGSISGFIDQVIK